LYDNLKGPGFEAAWRVGQDNINYKLIAAAKSFCDQILVKYADTAPEMRRGYSYSAEYQVGGSSGTSRWSRFMWGRDRKDHYDSESAALEKEEVNNHERHCLIR